MSEAHSRTSCSVRRRSVAVQQPSLFFHLTEHDEMGDSHPIRPSGPRAEPASAMHVPESAPALASRLQQTAQVRPVTHSWVDWSIFAVNTPTPGPVVRSTVDVEVTP